VAYAPYEFLWVVKESAYGTTKTSPVAGTDSHYIRLAGANRFQMRPVKRRVKVASGQGFAAPGYAVGGTWDVRGSLELELCASQAALLLGWAFTRINAGQTTPWTTTEPSGDLISCSVFHGIMTDTGTIRRRKYKGVKVHATRLASSAQNMTLMARFDLVAQKHEGNADDSSSDPDATAFPAPADTAFPVDPFLHCHFTPTFGGSAIGYAQSVELVSTPAMDPRYPTGSGARFLGFDRLRGRTNTVNLDTILTASPNWRSSFDALTSDDLSLVWDNGTNSITVDLKDNNLVDDLRDDLTPGQVFNQTLRFENQWDTGNSADIVFTYA